ncbi:MAG: hypothetical protein J0L92_36790 [Deltaproteobacteria bacterium]|nr:hypothetical protein [Deltaproteobacteria bacterium]
MRKLVASVAALTVAAAACRSVAADSYSAASSYEDVYYAPPATWMPLLSLGHREALADLLWCRALVYQGDETAHGGGLDHVFDYSEAMLALDPDFRAVYVWISSAGIYSPEGVTEADMDRTIALVRRGRERFPDDGQLAWVLGATLAFEAPPYTPEGRREAVRLEGLENLMEAVRLGAAPEWLVLSNTSMLAQLGRADRAIEHLEEMYSRVTDDAVRESIAQRIESVRSEAYGAGFVEANDRVERQRMESFPYLTTDMYLLVAPEPPPERRWGDVLEDDLAGQLLDE